ncbi:MAG: flavin reductase family protein [Methylococcaceae bacterium]|jgi:flavin reductase (DIM6/NTAB) family NADH-FMN oxidoreductase RutF
MAENQQKLDKLISQGVYVVGVCDQQHENAFTAAWVMQVSFQPFLLAFSISPEHYSYQLLQAGGVCTINVLEQTQQAIAQHFGSHSHSDKMAGYLWQKANSGAPILLSSLAYFDCLVSHYADAGDHKIVVCQVQDAGRLNEGQPMLYSQTGDMDGSSQLRSQ